MDKENHKIIVKTDNREKKENIKGRLDNNENKENLNTANNLNEKKKKKQIVVIQSEKKKVKSLVKKIQNPQSLEKNKKASNKNKIVDIISHKKEDNLCINDKTIYLDRENSLLLRNYGPEVYFYTKDLEKTCISKNFIKKHQINPEIRTKMVDWMIEVLTVYKSEAETFFLAVSIMDTYFDECKLILKSEDVHLIGMVSMFIASKFEDVIPIRMNSMISKIGHDMFSDRTIRQKEKKILETIGFETLVTTSHYEFIKTYFFDFLQNNKDQITELKLADIVKTFEKTTIFLGKIILHSECFYESRHSLNALACLIAAFDLVRTCSNSLKEEGEKFLRDWLMFLIQESSYNPERISQVYSKLVDYYQKYEKITFISHNLTKYNKINFE